jgi:hypothetical protein
MSELTPVWVSTLETNMRTVRNEEYFRLASSEAITWPKIMKRMPSSTRVEQLMWLWDSAQIKGAGKRGARFHFDTIEGHKTEFEAEHGTSLLRLTRDELLDKDQYGPNKAAHWSRQMGSYMAYWPQKLLIQSILAGGSAIGYDGKTFFATDHPVHPLAVANGTYANVFTSTASGLYPGACPIDASVPLNTAIANMARIFAYVYHIPMPNGEDPRYLHLDSLWYPPSMQLRIEQLFSAKFIVDIATAAASLVGGTADVGESVMKTFGKLDLVMSRELSTLGNGTTDETTYYLGAQEISQNEFGPFNYIERESFRITYYTGVDADASGLNLILARANELEWMLDGRNIVGLGHPYMFFKCLAA